MATTTNDDTQVRDLITAWAHAVEKRNIEAIIAQHAADILMFDVAHVQLQGMAAYKKSWEDEMFPWLGEHGTFQLHDLNVTMSETVAFATAILHCAGYELQNVGDKLTVRLTVGLQKQHDEWVVTHEHHSVTSDVA